MTQHASHEDSMRETLLYRRVGFRRGERGCGGHFSSAVPCARPQRREAYARLNGFLGWHGYLTLGVLPLAVAALCLGRVRPALLAFGLCCASWGVTTVLVANTFHGDRPPPDYRSTPGANKAPTASPAMASLFHAEYQWRGVA